MLVPSWPWLMSTLFSLSLIFTALALPSHFLEERMGDDETYRGKTSALPGATVLVNLSSAPIIEPSRTRDTFTPTHTYYHLPTGFTHLRFSYGAPIDRRIFSTLVADARKEVDSQWRRYGDSEVPPGGDPFIDHARRNTKLLVKSCGEACRLKYGLLKDVMTALSVFLVEEGWFFETQFTVFHDFKGQVAEGSIAQPTVQSSVVASGMAAQETWATS